MTTTTRKRMKASNSAWTPPAKARLQVIAQLVPRKPPKTHLAEKIAKLVTNRLRSETPQSMVMEANRMGKKVVTTTIAHMDTIATVKVVEDPASTKTDEVEVNIAAGIEVAIVDMEVVEAIKSANTEMTTEAKEDTMTSQDTTTEIEAMEEVTSIMKTRTVIVAMAAIEGTVVMGATERTVGMAATGTIEVIVVIVDIMVAATNAGMEVAFSKNSLSTSLTKIR